MLSHLNWIAMDSATEDCYVIYHSTLLLDQTYNLFAYCHSPHVFTR